MSHNVLICRCRADRSAGGFRICRSEKLATACASPSRPGLFPALLIALGILLASGACAPRLAWCEETGDSPEMLPFSKSMSFPRNRSVETVIREAQQAARRENWGLLADCLAHLAGNEAGTLVEFEGAIRDSSIAVEILMQQLPKTAQAAIERSLEPELQAKLQQATRRQDTGLIADIAQRYGFLPAGRQARTLLLALEHDQGKLPLASPAAAPLPQDSPPRSDVLPRPEAVWPQRHFVPLNLTGQVPERLPQDTIVAMYEVYQLLRQSGVIPYPSIHAGQADHTLVLTFPTRRVAIDITSLQVLWSRPVTGYGPDWMRAPGDLGDRFRHRLFKMATARSIFASTLFTECLIDGGRVYFLESVPTPTHLPPPPDADGNADDAAESFPTNQLVCVDLKTGQELWRQAGPAPSGIYFSGTPGLHGNTLYVLSELRTPSMLAVQEIDAFQGTILRQIELGAPKIPISDDTRRQEVNCQIVADGDHLLCPTGAGAVFRIDRLTGRIVWAQRTPRSDAQGFHGETDIIPVHQPGFQHWNAWQRQTLILQEGLMILACPTQSTLQAFERHGGQLKWSVDREEASLLLTADARQGVVTLSATQACSRDLKSGQKNWCVTLPAAAGQGTLVGQDYYFPIRDQGLAKLDLETGTFQQDVASACQPWQTEGVLPFSLRPRSLTMTEFGLLEFDIHQLWSLPVPWMWPGNLSPEQLLALEEQGSTQGVLGRMSPGLPGISRQILRQTSGVCSDFAAWLMSSQASLESRAIFRCRLAQAACQNQDLTRFVTIWLSAPEAEMSMLVADASARRRCRLDRWFQALSQELLSVLPAESQREFHQLIEQAWQKTSPQSPARAWLLSRLRHTPWGREREIQTPWQGEDLQASLQRQMVLLEITHHAEPRLAAGACARLLEFAESRAHWPAAQRWLTQLQTFPEQTELPQGGTAGRTVAAHAPRIAAALTADATRADWPAISPTTRLRRRGSNEVFFAAIPRRSLFASNVDQMAVEVDSPAHQAVRFNSATRSRPWFCPLPRSQRLLRFDPTLDLLHGMEDLLVLQCGSEVYGLTPYALDGKPAGTLLWPEQDHSVDTLAERDNLLLTFQREPVQVRPGFSNARYRRMDEFLHDVTAVEPVRPGYLCLQQLGMLVAIEPATGQELWRRYDLPRRARCLGDDEQVTVYSPEEATWTTYRTLDGQQLSVRKGDDSPENHIAQSGCEAVSLLGEESQLALPDETLVPTVESLESLTPSPGTEVVITRSHVPTGEQRWQRRFPARSMPFEINARWLGVLLPENQLEWIDTQTGGTVLQQRLTLEQPVQRIAAIAGGQDIILGFATHLDSRPAPWNALIRGGYRRPVFTGRLVCFDTQTLHTRWQQPVRQTELPLDQAPDLPILLTTAPRPSLTGSLAEPPVVPEAEPVPEPPAAPDGTDETDLEENDEFPDSLQFECRDRRTGLLLGTLPQVDGTMPYFTLHGNRQQGLIKLQQIGSQLEMDFSRPADLPTHAPGAESSSRTPDPVGK